MSIDNLPKSANWILALGFTAGVILLLVFAPQFFWVLLPFAGVFLAKAFNVI
ncbi:MAG: hypothetical protein RI955_1080 [Bacteroidota bacterium]|jgi:hypothetical protein